MNQSNLVCTVCKKPKFSLRQRKSKLIPGGKQMFLCDECFKNKREPRWAIILVARSEGHEAVSDWIKNNRYVGEPILLSDLVD
jgi:hypothetical protein